MNVSKVSVSRRPGPPQVGQVVRTKCSSLVSGEPPEPVTKKKKTHKKKPPAAPKQSTSEQQQLQDLRDRLLKELQNGASP